MTRRRQFQIALLAGAMTLSATAANAAVYRVGEAWTVGKEANYYATFQELLDSAKGRASTDTIWVAAGTQSLRRQWENSGHQGRFFGGFAGTETSIAQREFVANGYAWELKYPTTLKLADTASLPNQSILRISAGNTPLEIDGFSFDGATCTGGAAIFIRATASGQTIAIRRCVIRNTTVTAANTSGTDDWGAAGISLGGYGANLTYLQATVDRCLIENNKGTRGGGYFAYSSAKQVVSGCLIRNNEGGNANLLGTPSVTGGGGGLTMLGTYGQTTVVNNIVEGNTSTIAGGGIAIGLMGCQLSNNIIVNNSAPTGGGLYINTMAATATYRTLSYNNIFWNNKNSGDGSVNNVDRNGKYVVFNNNIVDAIPAGAEGATAAGTAPVGNVLESDSAKIFGEKWGTFAAAVGVDKGNSANIPNTFTTDFAGNARLSGSAVDVGAFELQEVYVAPSKPSNLKATNVADTCFTLAWTASTGSVEGYIIYLANAAVDTVPSTQTSYLFSKPAYTIAASTNYAVAVAAYDTTGFVNAATNLSVRTAPGANFLKVTVQSAYVSVSANSTGATSPANPYYYYVAPGSAFWAKVAAKEGFQNLHPTVDGIGVALSNDTLHIASVTADVDIDFTADRQRYKLSTACNSDFVEILSQPASDTVFHDSTYLVTFRLKQDGLTPYASNGTVSAPENGVYKLSLANVKANTGLYVGAIGSAQASVQVANSASVSSKGTSMLQGTFATYLKVQTGSNQDTMEAYLKFSLSINQLLSAASNGARLKLQTNNAPPAPPTSNFNQVVWSIQEVSSSWAGTFTGVTGVSGAGAQWAERPAPTVQGEIATLGAGIKVVSNQPFYVDLSSYLSQLAATATNSVGNVEFAIKIASKTELPSPYGLLNILNPAFANWADAAKPALEIGRRTIALTFNAPGITIDSTNADSLCVGDTLYCAFKLRVGYIDPTYNGVAIPNVGDVYTLKILLSSTSPITIATTTNYQAVRVAANPYITVTSASATTNAAGDYDVFPGDNFWMKFALKAGYENLRVTVNGAAATIRQDTLFIAAVDADKEVVFTADRLRYHVSAACNSTLVELLSQPASDTVFYDSTYVATFRLKQDGLTPYASNGVVSAPENSVYTLTVANVKANTDLYIGAIASTQASVAVANSASVSSKGTSMLQGTFATYLKVQTGSNQDTMEAYLKFSVSINQLLSAASNGARLKLQTNNAPPAPPTSNFNQVVWSIQEVNSSWAGTFTGVSPSALWAERPAPTAQGEIATLGAGIKVVSNQPFYVDLSSYLSQLAATAVPDSAGKVEFAIKLASKTELPSPYGLLNILNPAFANWTDAAKPALEIGRRAVAIRLDTVGISIISSNADSLCLGDTLSCTFTLKPSYNNPLCADATITNVGDVYTLKLLLKSAAPIAITASQLKHTVSIDGYPNPYASIAASFNGAQRQSYEVVHDSVFWLKMSLNAGFSNLTATVNGNPATWRGDTLYIASVDEDKLVIFSADNQSYSILTSCDASRIELVEVPATSVSFGAIYKIKFRLKQDGLQPYATAGVILAPIDGVYTDSLTMPANNIKLYIGAIGERTARVDFVDAASVSSKGTNMLVGGLYANYLQVLKDTVNSDTMEAYLKLSLTAAQLYSAAYNGARLCLQTNNTLSYTTVRFGVYEVSSSWSSAFTGVSPNALWADRPAITALGKVGEAGYGLQVTSNQPFYIDLSDYIARLAPTLTPDANGNVELAIKLVSEDILAPRVVFNNPMFTNFQASQKPNLEVGYRTIAVPLDTTGIAIVSSNANAVSVGDTLICTFTLKRGYGNPQCEGATITGPDNDVYTLTVLVKSPAPIVITASQQLYRVTISAGAGIVVTDSGNRSLPLDATFTMKFKLAAGYESPISMVGTISAPDANGEYTLTITNISADITVAPQATYNPTTGIDDVNDPVVAVQYYNFMGREVREPQHSDLVIVKRTHASGKVTVSKEVRFTHQR
ncbi:MAG: hypothetical protein LBS94_04970 [Prevotellaceae bacterium]|jgi:hypothetical protein|nr:hypothetical protein [Prevotellaceae bacterium]